MAQGNKIRESRTNLKNIEKYFSKRDDFLLFSVFDERFIVVTYFDFRSTTYKYSIIYTNQKFEPGK